MENNHKQENQIFCSWCGKQSYIVWVHGHGQCANCGLNIDECCRGEICGQSFETKQANVNKK